MEVGRFLANWLVFKPIWPFTLTITFALNKHQAKLCDRQVIGRYYIHNY